MTRLLKLSVAEQEKCFDLDCGFIAEDLEHATEARLVRVRADGTALVMEEGIKWNMCRPHTMMALPAFAWVELCEQT